LQVIMHVVVIEVCASLTALPLAADAPAPIPRAATTAKTMVMPRTTASQDRNPNSQHNATAAAQECARSRMTNAAR
jgi:hypothetical protein